MAGGLRFARRARKTNWAILLGDVGRLVWRLARDDRVPMKVRVGLVGVGVYVASPVDLIPWWVPLASRVDDAIVMLVGVRMLLRMVPEPLLLEHWPGTPENLERVLGRSLGPEVASA